MIHALLPALLAFCAVSTVTPGPNNMMLMASGANFGYRRTLPHMLGIALGVAGLVLGVGTGLMALFDLWPASYTALKVAAVAYMLWLAWKIANAATPEGASAGGRPLTFLQGAGFQWVNPKAWSMALTAITVYAPDRTLASVALVGAAFALVSLPLISLWVVAGQQLKRWLTSPARLRGFNWTMAALLLGSLYPVLM
ncbi:LysE family translocator [Vannielia litorea]|uniref:Threonine/homoserine/homoserine lactone efflux protein n=1 Tax=Vannielia litorea TaxID=1217970 RepID=A0A1N6GQ14_9RHOB|nr:LysE family translocator [Vannielia litorea]SIO09621.1 Threonine/homoserine/homoserine lactone efflux protein [Vannielia litorea]